MSAAVQASPLNRLAANLEELGLEGMASSVPEYVRLVADGRKSLVDAMLELTDAQIALKRRADDERRTRMTQLPYIKTLADFDWGFQPSVPRGWSSSWPRSGSSTAATTSCSSAARASARPTCRWPPGTRR